MKCGGLVMAGVAAGPGFPDDASLAALRAWYVGLDARAAVVRYLHSVKADGQSSRSMLGNIRRQLAAFARARRRADLAELFESPAAGRTKRVEAVNAAIEVLRNLPIAEPLYGDQVSDWLDDRLAGPLVAYGISTIGELLHRVPRRRMWWSAIPGLGKVGGRRIEAFVAAYPRLTENVLAHIAQAPPPELLPWELIQAPEVLDGSRGLYRAPVATCTLSAGNDHQAINAWLELHESAATRRAYRKEAERLILWAIVERGKAMSSLTVEDATAYRSFLRRPAPASRWVGPQQSRRSPDWKPFAGPLSPRSAAFALSVIGAMYQWLIKQRYLLANPFAGLKVKGSARAGAVDVSRSFTDGEWRMIRTVADGLEGLYGWGEQAARRLRFLLDFMYSTGLRATEFVTSTLKQVSPDHVGSVWLHLVGKGDKPGKVFLPATSMGALNSYLAYRGLPTTPSRWNPKTPVVGRIAEDDVGAISVARLWAVIKRFFALVADLVESENPGLAAKLRKASPHWMRHTHATYALNNGAELTSVRDNLRHASISTTSVYLHADDSRRSAQLDRVFSTGH